MTAYKKVGEELKLIIDGFDPKPDDIDIMRDEFPGLQKVTYDPLKPYKNKFRRPRLRILSSITSLIY